MSDRPSSLRLVLGAASSAIAAAGAAVLFGSMLSGAWATDLLGRNGSGASAPATSAAQAAAQAQAQAAQRAAQHSIEMLGRTTQMIQTMRSAQDAARGLAAQMPTNVTDGLSPGGLIVDPRVKSDPGLWVNAKPPSQTVSEGQVTVTIEQQAQRALLTWQQFNVGRDTTVYFDQRAGTSATGNGWIALNRIDATGVPSQILGRIKAEGTVVLINPNGIVFNGTSQINVHSLIAAAMDTNSFTGSANGAFKASGDAYVPVLVGGLPQTTPGGTPILAPSDEANANKVFLDNGLFINRSFNLPGTFTSTGPSALFSAGLIPGQSSAGVIVKAGARIVTDVSGFDNGGFVALLGPQVTNAGSIETRAGSIILAAGSSALIAEPASGTAQTQYLARTALGELLRYFPPSLQSLPRAVNSGLLVSHRGNITLIGDSVEQEGIAEATTSITRAGSITLVANWDNVVFGAASLTTILPEGNGETIPSDSASLANFVAPRIGVSGLNIDFKSGSLVYAPSATMTVTGVGQGNQSDGSPPLPSGRVLMEAGSTIDLSGLSAIRSVADYLTTFKVTGNDVADTPLAQNLIGETVTIDLSLTGTRADGQPWVGSPLFASSGAGYLANIAQGIDQLLTKGGSLSFSSGFALGNGLTSGAFTDVLQAPGAVINVSGGTIQYTGAAINTTRLISSDGRLFDIGGADPFITYRGLAGTYVVDHPRWGRKEIYANHLYSGGYYKGGYTNGLSAGDLAVTAVHPILEGDLVGDIVVGAQQRLLAQAGTGAGGAQATPDQLPVGGSLSITLVADPASELNSVVVLEKMAPKLLDPSFSLTTPLTLPTRADGNPIITYSADRLSAAGLGSIAINGAGSLSVTADVGLTVLPGGSITLSNVSTIDGAITAHGGVISISGWTPSSGNFQRAALPPLTLGAGARLDASGQWINDAGRFTDDFQGALYIDGGSVSLTTTARSTVVSYNSSTRFVTANDRTQSILLAAGSVIDVSSGGYVGSNGRLALGSDGLPKGKGGNVSLTTYSGGWNGITNQFQLAQSITGLAKYAPTAANVANVIMDGTIYAGGLSQGGTFTLQVPTITIDGNATEVTSVTSGAQSGTIVLPTSFFTDSGFSSYKLTSTYGSATVTAGTTLTLKQQNYLASSMTSLPGTGARVRDFASLGFVPDGMRHAVDFSLNEVAFPFGSTSADDPSASARTLIDAGATILADPLAKITLAAGGPVVVLGAIHAPGGSISITEGFVTPLGSTLTATPGNAATDGLPQYVWIGDHAVLDVSGTFVPDPRVTAYSTGSALSGGLISINTYSGSSYGTFIAEQGSIFDISGASGTIEQLGAAGGIGALRLVERQVWSDGGSLTMPGGYFAGEIRAAGGAPQAAGGALTIGTMSATNALVIAQSGNVAASFAGVAPPTKRAALNAFQPATKINITADTINTAHLDTFSAVGQLAFSGGVNLKVAGSIVVDTNNYPIALLPAGNANASYSAPSCSPSSSCIPTINATNVSLEAGYIRLANSNGAFSPSNLPALADGSLRLHATSQIDLVGTLAVRNASVVSLESDGDIRLIGVRNFGTPQSGGGGVTAIGSGFGGLPYAGGLIVADNLTFKAREIYPSTDTAFLLMSRSLAPAGVPSVHNTITFASNGKTPVAPLSAGGAIIVDAKMIVQGGALYAPLGTIQLGFGAGQTLPSVFINGVTNDPYNPLTTVGSLYGNSITTVATDSVTLAPGSVTSVSAAGLAIPYGQTTDGVDWTDNNTLLSGPPAKLIVLGGAKIDAQSGAVVDGRGGGDIYATEFVPGTGGSRNVLTPYSAVTVNGVTTQVPLYPDGRQIYALVPSYSAAVAAYDPSFGSAFGVSIAAGTSVTLAGGNGIPPGTYTLLPGMYATLPGAYRVVVASTNASPYAQTITTPDGSVYMTGVLGNAINGSRSSQTALLQIQPNSTWTRYSEIDIVKGDAYFAHLAASKGIVPPRLARDAARIVITASSALTLNGVNRFDPAANGLGGQLDVSGSNILVVASDRLSDFGVVSNGVFTPNATYTGYLALDADMLSNLGIESILIGGYRSDVAEGTLISATALNLEIATNASHKLNGPELLFASLAPTSANPNVRGLVVDAGSVIEAKGAVSGGPGAPLVFGADPTANYNTATGAITSWKAGVSGDGSLLRVSNGGLVGVTRHFVPGVYQIPATTPAPAGPVSTIARGSLAIGAGVRLVGNTVALDSSGATVLDVTASLDAKNYDLAGGIVNLGGGAGGLVVTADLISKFAGADTVRLRSASVFNVHGSNAFGKASNRIGTFVFDGSGFYSEGGATSIAARDVSFIDTQPVANSAGADTSGSGGTLTIDASGVLAFGTGAKNFVGFSTISAAAGSQILFSGSGSVDAKAADVSLTAPVIVADKAAVQSLTTTGLLTIARGQGAAPEIDAGVVGGALALSAGSILDSGVLMARSGKLTLEATSGDLTLSDSASISAAGSRIMLFDLIQHTPAGTVRLYSDAGDVTLGAGTSIDVSAAGRGYAGSLSIYAKNRVSLGGEIAGGAAYQDIGGEFTLIADRIAGNLPYASGFTRSFSVGLGQGDIRIGAGQTLTSANVRLVANNGGVFVDGVIDASSPSGGSIALYGAGSSTAAAGTADASGVTIGKTARLYARYRAADPNSPAYANGESALVQRGGTITLGTTGAPDGTVNAAHGYQNVPHSGAISVAAGAMFDVSGGPGGANIDNTGGSVIVRAPLLTDGNVNVAFKGKIVTSAKSDGTASGDGLVAGSFVTWSTTDGSAGGRHFDGIIDPAGWYDSAGNQLPGSWANPQMLPLSNGGSGYTSAPTVTLQGAGWSNVQATAVMGAAVNGFVQPMSTAQGAGFVNGTYLCSGNVCKSGTNVINVTFGGSGTGAALSQVVVSGGKIYYGLGSQAGSGYDSPVTVTFDGGPGTTPAIARVNLTVVALSVSAPAGTVPANTPPTGVTFTGGGGAGAGISSNVTTAQLVWTSSDGSYAGTAPGIVIAGTGVFTPSNPNPAHVDFYQTTLKNFVNSPFDSAVLAQNFDGATVQVGASAPSALPASMLHLRPEISLVNPSTSINKGDITVASNWNFGAGTLDPHGNVMLLMRTSDGGEPGRLTLRAAGNVAINASITDGFFTNYAPGAVATDAATLYANEIGSSLYASYKALFSGGLPVFGSSGVNAYLAGRGKSWSSLGLTAPPTSLTASAEFFNVSPAVFNALQFDIQAPITLSCVGGPCAPAIIDQYNQYYAAYVRLFRAYETEIVALDTNAPLGNGAQRVFGPAILSYADAASLYGKLNGFIAVDPRTLSAPSQPGTSTVYLNLTGNVFSDWNTPANDYASLWAVYFSEVIRANLGNSVGGRYPLSTFVGFVYGSGTAVTFDRVTGLDAAPGGFGVVGAVVATPPYAPGAYTTLMPGYLSSSANVHPSDLIANNPAAYNSAVGAVTVTDTISVANLMTAAVSGKGSFSYNFVGGAAFTAGGASTVDPDAVVGLASLSSSATGNVTIDGHSNRTPSVVRTGTGSITISAANDFALLDKQVPGAVYTAGYAAANANGFTAPSYASTAKGNISKPTWATDGGDIRVAAGRDIVGLEAPVDTYGIILGNSVSVGVSTGEFWSAWYFVNGKSTGSATTPFDPIAGGEQYSSWINYGTFFQGLGALGGGDITLIAARNVKDISASLPETIQVSGGQSTTSGAAMAHYYGGGNLLVEAGADVLSGAYYVGRGAGLIRAGGAVASDITLYQSYTNSGALTITNPSTNQKTPFAVPLLLAVQDGFIDVQAAGAITLGGIFQPTRIKRDTFRTGAVPGNSDAVFDSYGANSGVSLTSVGGSIAVITMPSDDQSYTATLFSHDAYGKNITAGLIPPTLEVTALSGDINLNPGLASNRMSLHAAPTGTLTLVAAGSILGTSALVPINSASITSRGEYAAGDLISPFPSVLGTPFPALTAPLHADDPDPVIIYAGLDIIGGSFTLPKPARIWAGRDILNVNFTGENNAAEDITSIVAGRDIGAMRLPDMLNQVRPTASSLFAFYGPGDIVIEAGRNLGPFNTNGGSGGGIIAVGNGSNSGSSFRPYLPLAGADITVRYGVGHGIDYAAAIATYGDAATAAASGIDFVATIIPRLEQLLEQLIAKQAEAAGIANPQVDVTLTPAEAADLFTALPRQAISGKLAALAEKAGLAGLSFDLTPTAFLSLIQQQEAMKLEIDRGFLGLLTRVSLDYNNASSPYHGQYARAYEAIATLFPASLDYTDNSGGGSGTSPALKHTGDLRMARSLIETQTGGDINILGPGGNAYVGSNSADKLLPSQQGILTLQGGSVRTYTDGSVLIYQSRIFTEQGGNIEMFSANGDLNAGKGPRSSAAYPPLRLICDAFGYCRVNPTGLVTGAGIGALLSVAGQDPTKSNVYLSAPRGIIDFGAAGVRTLGDLNVVAPVVLNSFNATVGGTSTGVPTFQAPDVGGLTQATSTSAAAVSDAAAGPGQQAPAEQPSIIIVEVIGYGGGDGTTEDRGENRRREK